MALFSAQKGWNTKALSAECCFQWGHMQHVGICDHYASSLLLVALVLGWIIFQMFRPASNMWTPTKSRKCWGCQVKHYDHILNLKHFMGAGHSSVQNESSATQDKRNIQSYECTCIPHTSGAVHEWPHLVHLSPWFHHFMNSNWLWFYWIKSRCQFSLLFVCQGQ